MFQKIPGLISRRGPPAATQIQLEIEFSMGIQGFCILEIGKEALGDRKYARKAAAGNDALRVPSMSEGGELKPYGPRGIHEASRSKVHMGAPDSKGPPRLVKGPFAVGRLGIQPLDGRLIPNEGEKRG